MGQWGPQFPKMLFDWQFYLPLEGKKEGFTGIIIFCLAVLISHFLFRDRTRLRIMPSLIVSIMLSFSAFFTYAYWLHFPHEPESKIFMIPLSVVLLPPFVLMVIEGLRGLPPRELGDTMQPQSMTIWLTTLQVIWAVLLSASLYIGWGWPLWLALILTLGSLAAIPFVANTSRTMGTGGNTMSRQDGPVDDMTEERARVLKLMEDGRITPGEASELLGALAETHRVEAPQPATVTPHRRLMFIGAALMAVALFLPWFSVNLGKEMNQAWHSIEWMIPELMQEANSRMIRTGNVKINESTNIELNGGQVKNGLGWIVTVLGLAAALAPMLFAMRRHTARSLTLLCLIGGAVILLYVVASSFRFVSYGLVLSLIGFVLIAVGGLREYELLTGMRFQSAKTAEGAH